MTIARLIAGRDQQILTCSPEETVRHAAERLAANRIGAMPVVSGDQVIGIFSERDYARKIALKGRSSRDTPLRDVMTADVICVTPLQTADKCMAIMTDKRIRHLPVLEEGHLAGIISIGDVVKTIMNEQRVMINHLEDYIHG